MIDLIKIKLWSAGSECFFSYLSLQLSEVLNLLGCVCVFKGTVDLEREEGEECEENMEVFDDSSSSPSGTLRNYPLTCKVLYSYKVWNPPHTHTRTHKGLQLHGHTLTYQMSAATCATTKRTITHNRMLPCTHKLLHF